MKPLASLALGLFAAVLFGAMIFSFAHDIGYAAAKSYWSRSCSAGTAP